MKKTLLWGTLITLICTQAHSDATQATNPTQQQNGTTTNTNTVNPTSGNATSNPATVNTLQNANTTQPTVQQTNTSSGTTNQQTPTTGQATPPQTPPVIDCNYKIPADTKVIDQTLVLTWSQAATTQAFDFSPDSLDAQMQKLQSCFTDQGWLSFNTALQKSGNIDAIKSQKLHVSSQIDGQALLTDSQDGQWKVNVPIQVVYQNDKEKVTQLLTVSLTIGRKKTGDLGINQMIATPRSANAAQQNSTGSTSGTTSSDNSNTDNATNANPANANSTTPTVNNTSNPSNTATTTQGQ